MKRIGEYALSGVLVIAVFLALTVIFKPPTPTKTREPRIVEAHNIQVELVSETIEIERSSLELDGSLMTTLTNGERFRIRPGAIDTDVECAPQSGPTLICEGENFVLHVTFVNATGVTTPTP